MNFKTLGYVVSSDSCKSNGRLKLLPNEDGVYVPHELVCFTRPTYLKPGWERVPLPKEPKYGNFFIDEISEEAEDMLLSVSDPEENRRKSYNRARNNLFDLLMSTTVFDCFVTLTLDSAVIEDRADYSVIVKKLGQWLDNRVRRNGMVYVFVPEFHKDGCIHFHGCINMNSVKTVRAVSPYTGKPLNDDEGRPIYNISDYKMGFSTLIPLSGENARIATAKYCYKYITKSKGEKCGGRYYLSGGALGRPKYEYVDVDYENVPGKELHLGAYGIAVKKFRFEEED